MSCFLPPFQRGPGGILNDAAGKIPLSPPLKKGEAGVSRAFSTPFFKLDKALLRTFQLFKPLPNGLPSVDRLIITDLGEASISGCCPQPPVFTWRRAEIPGKRRFPKRQMSRIFGSQNPGTGKFSVLPFNKFRMLCPTQNPL